MNESSIRHMLNIVAANLGSETPRALTITRIGSRIVLRWRTCPVGALSASETLTPMISYASTVGASCGVGSET